MKKIRNAARKDSVAVASTETTGANLKADNVGKPITILDPISQTIVVEGRLEQFTSRPNYVPTVTYRRVNSYGEDTPPEPTHGKRIVRIDTQIRLTTRDTINVTIHGDTPIIIEDA